MSTATISRRPTRRPASRSQAAGRPVQLTLPYHVFEGATEHGIDPLAAIISQWKGDQPVIEHIADDDEAEMILAELNECPAIGLAGYVCKIVSVTVEVPPAIARKIEANRSATEELRRRKPR